MNKQEFAKKVQRSIDELLEICVKSDNYGEMIAQLTYDMQTLSSFMILQLVAKIDDPEAREWEFQKYREIVNERILKIYDDVLNLKQK